MYEYICKDCTHSLVYVTATLQHTATHCNTQLVDKLEEESVAMKTKYEMFFEERHLAEKKRVQLEKEEEERVRE